MMKNKRTILIALTAFLTGGILGWLIFSRPDMASPSQAADATGTDITEQVWTCSMHPQIRQNEPSLCPICEMDLIPLEANISDDPYVLQMSENAVQLANIQTSTVGPVRQGVEEGLSLAGRIKADERRISSQVSHVPGRIEKLYISFTGQQVYAGTKLADIYSPDLITAQSELIEASKLEGNPELLQAARSKLRFWKIPVATIDEILASGEIQELFPVYASESGVVSERLVAVGDYVERGETLLKLINLNRLWVLFDAYEKDLPYIRLNQKIHFRTNAYPDRVFQARVSFIDPLINPDTRVATVRAEVPNRDGLLKPEMFVSGQLESVSPAVEEKQLYIPKSAVLWTGTRSVVYVRLPGSDIPSFEFREISLGDAVGNSYVVNSGLESGEEVVTYGSFVIDAAAQLNNQASMMNRDIQIRPEHRLDPDFRDLSPSEFRRQLGTVSEIYLELKDALVEGQPEQARTKAAELQESLQEVDMTLLKAEAHVFWMEKLKALEAHSGILAESNRLEQQREQFEYLSDAMISSLAAFGVQGKSLYVQFCPMAFDNKGAAWVSDKSEIRNPYFGDKMLKCGVVRDTFN